MKKRRDCFFGVHTDFHAGKNTVIGDLKNFDITLFRLFLDQVKPDFIQVDTKGHGGYSSYDTKVGEKPDAFSDDRLPLIRTETAKRGILLYGHHSGVFDNAALKSHPEWAALDKDGKASFRFGSMSVFGKYADERLIPQLKELALDYKLDGAWLDGECWAAENDFSPVAISAYKQKYGKDPDLNSESGKNIYKEFLRQGFFDYVKHVQDEVKKSAPEFEITSNWAKSSSAPTSEDLHLPFLSGDLSPNNSFFWAKIESMFLAQNKMPWDIMAWGFLYNGTDTIKSAVQLSQELAVIASYGGGVQVYFMQTPDRIPVSKSAVNILRNVAEFIKPRAYLHLFSQEKEIGVFYGVKEYYLNCKDHLFQEHSDYYLDSLHLLDLSSNAGYSTNVVLDDAKDDLSEYGSVVVTSYLVGKDNAERLLEYANNGGNLVLLGEAAAELADHVGVSVTEKSMKFLPARIDGVFAGSGCYEETYLFNAEKGETVIPCFTDKTETGTTFAAALKVSYGKGKIAFCGFDLGKAYKKTRNSRYLRCFYNLVGKDRIAETDSDSLFTNVLRNGENMIVNLVNATHGEFDPENIAFDELPEIKDVKLTVRTPEKPSSVVLLPENKPISFNYDGETLTVERINVHVHLSVAINF